MKLDGTIDIAAAPQAVWDLIIDPVSLAACVPGVRDVRQVDPRTFEGSVSASVGPVDGNFSFTSIIERAVFPGDLGVSVGGVDSVTKSRLEAADRGRVERVRRGPDPAHVQRGHQGQGPPGDPRRDDAPGNGQPDDRAGHEVPPVAARARRSGGSCRAGRRRPVSRT